MNPRIKKLADEAGSVYQKNLDVYLLRHDELEKFAELIVQECAYINFYKRTDISLKDAYRVSQVILEHFGVEE